MASRSKRRKLELTKPAPKSAAERVANVTFNEMYKAVRQLAFLQKKHGDEIGMLFEQVGELSLRIRYIMQHFKFEKTSAITGLDGRPVQSQVSTLFDLYLAEREPFLALLQQEHAHAEAVHSNASGKTAGEGTSADADADADAIPSSADAVAVAARRPTLVHSA